MISVSKLRFPAAALAVAATFSWLAAPPAAAQTAEPLLQKSNLVYLGAFRVPQGSGNATFDYGGTALTFNPANDSLYMVGHDWYQQSAEISIPAVVNSTSIGSLNTATILQPFADATEGKLKQINPGDPNPQKIGGQLVSGGKLIVSGFSFYDGNVTQSSSHFVRPLTLAASGQVQGPFKVGSLYPGFVSGYMTPIPSEWQSSLGGTALTGNCCLNIISAQSNGPAASAFNPSQLGSANPVPATMLVGYPYGHQLGPGLSAQNNYFNMSTQITGVAFPAGTRSVLFFGRQGTGPYCYGPGTSTQSQAGQPADGGVDTWCYDPSDSSKGDHAYPYVYQVWAYDANDLLAVKQGSKQPYEVQPYAVWAFNLPFENSSDQHLLGGAAYDPASNRIYISQRCEDANCAPVIQVFKVNGSVVNPSPPGNVQVH